MNTLEGNPVQLGREVGGQTVQGKNHGRRKDRKTDVGGQWSEEKQREDTFGNLRFRFTWDIINAAQNGLLPDRIMINTHPQRWDDRFVPWTKELVWQNIKNIVKKQFVGYRLK